MPRYRTIEASPLATPYPRRVTGSRVGAAATMSVPALIPAIPVQTAARRPILPVSQGRARPTMMPPTAIAVPCSPATAWDTPWSRRSSGRAALRPYR